jgi:hypothetical protein
VGLVIGVLVSTAVIGGTILVLDKRLEGSPRPPALEPCDFEALKERARGDARTTLAVDDPLTGRHSVRPRRERRGRGARTSIGHKLP